MRTPNLRRKHVQIGMSAAVALLSVHSVSAQSLLDQFDVQQQTDPAETSFVDHSRIKQIRPTLDISKSGEHIRLSGRIEPGAVGQIQSAGSLEGPWTPRLSPPTINGFFLVDVERRGQREFFRVLQIQADEEDSEPGRIAELIAPGRVQGSSGEPSPEDRPHELTSFSVTTDSVVATANLGFAGSHRRVTLYWGDDSVDTIDLDRYRIETLASAGGVQSTLEIQHVYREPFDIGRKLVVAVAEGRDGEIGWSAEVINTDPHYDLFFYQVVLEFPEHLDFGGDYSEPKYKLTLSQDNWILKQKEGHEPVLTAPDLTIPGWRARWTLEGTEFSTQIADSDSPIVVDLELRELDSGGQEALDFLDGALEILGRFPNFYEFDGDGPRGPLTIHPRIALSRHNLQTEIDLGSDGKVLAFFSYDLKLIIPLHHDHPVTAAK